MDASIFDHLVTRGLTHSRTTQDRYLIQLGGAILPQCGVFLAAWSNIERLSCLVGRAFVASLSGHSSHSISLEKWEYSIVWVARHEVERLVDYRWEDIVASCQWTFFGQEWQWAFHFYGAVGRVSERNTKHVKVTVIGELVLTQGRGLISRRFVFDDFSSASLAMRPCSREKLRNPVERTWRNMLLVQLRTNIDKSSSISCCRDTELVSCPREVPVGDSKNLRKLQKVPEFDQAPRTSLSYRSGSFILN